MTIKRPLISLFAKTRSISEIRISPAGWMRMPKQKGCTSCLMMLYKLFDNNILSWLFENNMLYKLFEKDILSWLFEKKGLRANN